MTMHKMKTWESVEQAVGPSMCESKSMLGLANSHIVVLTHILTCCFFPHSSGILGASLVFVACGSGTAVESVP